jgi:two-component system sensor histidine kinase BarA
MSYRTLKRALGETNIERKCRIGFGFCLAILISVAFYLVDGICQRLISETTLRAGRDAVDMAVVNIHWNVWHTPSEDQNSEPARNRRVEDKLLNSFSEHLNMNRHKSTVLQYGEDPLTWNFVNHTPPTYEFERAILEDLKTKWEALVASQTAVEDTSQKSTETPTGAVKSETPEKQNTEPVELEMPGRAVPVPTQKKFFYYQPVNWANECTTVCHIAYSGALTASEQEAYKAMVPFRVVRVEMPYEATREARNWVRATLWAAGILTVFVAMIGLYVIVRYVIVKPLKHLRDVSDDISRGDTKLRADIHTNDEFEDLADAFNRMLRHLTEAQEQLQTTNVKLDIKVDELAQVNMQLYEMNRLKSDFLANMSHELRTPLNSIIGFSDVLQGIDSLTEKQRRYAENIQKSGRVLLDMINDILDLAKLEAGKMEVRPTEFRLDAVINAQCDMMRSLSEDKNIDLEVFTDPNAPPIYQDQSKVQQILTNLLSNAIKFTPEGGRIVVRAATAPDDNLELTVSDTGVGIPEEDRSIIFEKFRQSKTVLGRDGLTREYSGTGLGLSIVKELCKLLGGEISFVSELGKGSTFKVVLPWSLPNRPRIAAA